MPGGELNIAADVPAGRRNVSRNIQLASGHGRPLPISAAWDGCKHGSGGEHARRRTLRRTAHQYPELYLASVALRSFRMASGSPPPFFTPSVHTAVTGSAALFHSPSCSGVSV